VRTRSVHRRRILDTCPNRKEHHMLQQASAVATLGVRNIDRARRFYETTLGLPKVAEEGSDFIVFKSGDSVINVYRSEFAGTNKATAVTWVVGAQLESIVKALKEKGVDFEHYDMPGMTRQGDIHVGADMKAAWFKDPDGNIHNLASG
jgi:catechol 2,3-dioxygenase-like lactoylglutathione lyase family enzyme